MPNSSFLNQPPTDKNQPYVFISYARRDAPYDQSVAEQIEACLLAAGIHCFRDVNIPEGSDWNKAINKALKECNRMVLLLSPASMKTEPYRQEVYDEWFPFSQAKKTIYPIKVAECEPDRRLVAINHIDACIDVTAAINKLLNAIRRDFKLDETPLAQNALPTFYNERVTEWSQPRYLLDKRFVNLTLILDQGKDEQQRWRDDDKFTDLRDVLKKEIDGKPHPVFVLLGAPGSGKSTLLRRLQLDHSLDCLREVGEQVSFFIQLNSYRPQNEQPLPPPRQWLSERWHERYPSLPPLENYLQKGQLILLLDALNEMPHKNALHYSNLVEAWRTFTQEVCRLGNQIVFSCRELDYSSTLSQNEVLTVPHIRVQQLDEDGVKTFLQAYCPAQAERVWEELQGTPQLELFKTPYFLRLLCEQVDSANAIPKGRAALFTGFARKAIEREVERRTPLFLPDTLLSERDHTMIARKYQGHHSFILPERGVLIPCLNRLAFQMQSAEKKTESAQVRVNFDKACDLIAHDRAEDIIKAGQALNALDERGNDILFFHQLLQEYFAARRLAKEPNPALVHIEWTTDKVRPTLTETLTELSSNDPLPPLPQTGWEETTIIAAPMAENPAQFIREVMAHNLPLAARCAASPEVTINDELKREIQDALIARTQDMKTDLRARISAGEASGILGDPRFALRHGQHGEYLMPPMIPIAAGEYTIGDDKGDDEKPAHQVSIEAFQIGQFPVTNAEYAKFMAAGGYDDEQWWDTPDALRWLREGGAEGSKLRWREERKRIKSWSENFISSLVQKNRITEKQAEDWGTIRNWSEAEFEQWLDETFPQTTRQPNFWYDTRFNNPAQPVVGVTWFEARAYGNWIAANTGQLYRLPTEVEFEAAARGKQGRAFPYGNKFDAARGNIFESHIRRTTPVGIFDNATPEDAFDLSGNAYTWTLSIYDQDQFPYPYRSDDRREDILASGVKRALRGGSWDSDQDDSRAVYRDAYDPDSRNGCVGFRIICVPSFSELFRGGARSADA